MRCSPWRRLEKKQFKLILARLHLPRTARAVGEPSVRAWVSEADGFSPEPPVIKGQHAAIEIAPLGIALPLIYPGATPR
jgi:hypothetical protein